MRTVSSDDVTLAVHTFGDPDGRPLLLAHATGFHGRVWRAVAESFPERHCVALDFRGYGDSTMSAEPLSWHHFGRDLLAVVDALDLAADGPVDAVGHSKGGASLVLAELARPGTFGRLYLFEPIIFPPMPGGEDPPPGLAEGARRRRASFDSHDAAIERYRTTATLGRLRPDVLEDYVRHGFVHHDDGTITLKATPDHEADTYATGQLHGAFARLDEIGAQVVVAASGDGAAPAMAAPMVAEAIPDARLEVFEDLGHFGPLEDPPAVAAAIRAFLG